MTKLKKYLAEVKEREEKATTPPWKFDKYGDCIAPNDKNIFYKDHIKIVFSSDGDVILRQEDEDFIAKARQDVPKLRRMLEVALKECELWGGYHTYKNIIRELEQIAEERD